MLAINAIANGIVIDHITCGKGYAIFKMLKLDDNNHTVALIMNATSPRMGKKDLIKIENVTDLNLDIIGLIDPNATVNIIKDEKITMKIKLDVPLEIKGILQCKNPRCITTSERGIESSFSLIDRDKLLYQCNYCDHIYDMEE